MKDPNTLAMPGLMPTSWSAPEVGSLPAWDGAKRVGLDIETRDPDLKQTGIGVRREGYVIGVSFSLDGEVNHYLPFNHGDGTEAYGNLDRDAVLAYLKSALTSFGGTVVGANLQYDLDYLMELGVVGERPAFQVRDVQLAAPLLNELEDSYSLENIALRAGFSGKDEAGLKQAASMYGVDPKSGMWKLPAGHVGAYAEADASLPLRILEKLEERIDAEGLREIYDTESALLPILLRMRRRGVRFAWDRLQEADDWAMREAVKALAQVKRETGVSMGIGDMKKARVLDQIFQEKYGITAPRTKKSGEAQMDKAWLGSMPDNVVAQGILRVRKVLEIRKFVEQVKKHAVGDRIHTTFNQMARETEAGNTRGVRYGRMSSTDPNMQQQPKRGELKDIWRRIYIPEDGAEWASCDYSQQEPRWTMHYANMLSLPGSDDAVKQFNEDPDADVYAFMSEVTGLHRDAVKTIVLGRSYGMGQAKMARALGLEEEIIWAARHGENEKHTFHNTREEAIEAAQGNGVYEAASGKSREIIMQFDDRMPYIRMLSRFIEQRVKERGWVRTAGGRKLHFPQKRDGTYDWSYKGMNRLIQGSSADQMKIAMVELDRSLPEFYLQLQVHDEVDGSVSDRSVAERAASIMREALPARVPFKVSVETGPSWGEAK